ncbi:MAG: hypothetical protein COU31_02055 [Candidatus Magasanikbacteria bacterium CG10_big_fil_rev_8_21_14_0_10_40_10]|uniref:Uncharacterized protein n=1 Tax=Candidatus Magasanikbacteria bacterium CG10_big_fil_rev_8_21_14_0_10_40_10 TaxID=1974648 RepID=A0A2M6W471_9BACT|nr:MAG: hypothetical protein COU31_02055 [Candidatus Magasanikbacteria bacterium CG10_big_fil_rev_8_21_14_0_10_40_10]
MSKQFDRPSFLSQEIETNPIGKAQHVKSLDIPDNLRGPEYQGSVIKQIDDDPTDLSIQLGEDYLVARYVISAEKKLIEKTGNNPTLEELASFLEESENDWIKTMVERTEISGDLMHKIKYLKKLFEPAEIAKVIKNKYEFIRDFFEDALPDFIVDTQIVLGFKDDQSSTKIYYIQPKILGLDLSSSLCTLHLMHCDIDETGKKLIEAIKEKFSPEQIVKIIEQLTKLKEKIEELIIKENKVLDLIGPGNIMITDDGDLRLVDVDRFPNAYEIFEYPLGNHKKQETASLSYTKEFLQAFDNVIEALRN